MAIVDQDPDDTADGITMAEPKEVDGEYSSDQQQAISAGRLVLDFTYTFGAKIGNALNINSFIEISFNPEFKIELQTEAAARNAQFTCTVGCESTNAIVFEVVETVDGDGVVTRKSITVKNIFTKNLEQGEQLTFTLSGWYHTRGEACDAFIIYTWWEETIPNIVPGADPIVL